MVLRDWIMLFIGFAYICLFRFLWGGREKKHIETWIQPKIYVNNLFNEEANEKAVLDQIKRLNQEKRCPLQTKVFYISKDF